MDIRWFRNRTISNQACLHCWDAADNDDKSPMPLILNPKLIIRLECNEYNSVLTKFYGSDKRNAISYTLQQDGSYRQSAASGVVNKYLTINIDSAYARRTAKRAHYPHGRKFMKYYSIISTNFQHQTIMAAISKHHGFTRLLYYQKNKYVIAWQLETSLHQRKCPIK